MCSHGDWINCHDNVVDYDNPCFGHGCNPACGREKSVIETTVGNLFQAGTRVWVCGKSSDQGCNQHFHKKQGCSYCKDTKDYCKKQCGKCGFMRNRGVSE